LESQIKKRYGKATAQWFPQVQKKIKEKEELVSWPLKSKKPGEPGKKRRKAYVKEDKF
jgi:hypothetical protein